MIHYYFITCLEKKRPVVFGTREGADLSPTQV